MKYRSLTLTWKLALAALPIVTSTALLAGCAGMEMRSACGHASGGWKQISEPETAAALRHLAITSPNQNGLEGVAYEIWLAKGDETILCHAKKLSCGPSEWWRFRMESGTPKLIDQASQDCSIVISS